MYQQTSPHRRSRTGLWFAGYVIASLLLLLTSSTEASVTLQRVTTHALDPVRGAIASVGGSVAGLFGTIGEIDRLRAENADLHAALAGAEQRIAELTEAARENEELRGLLGISRSLSMTTLPVRVISRDPSNFAWEVGIDAGTDDGVHVGMPVVANADGTGALAGTVIGVTNDTARVRLVMDTRSVVIASLAVLGMDFIVSAGITFNGEASRYPSGLLIGTVQAVTEDPNALTQTAFVRPASDPDAERMLVILDFNQG